MIGKVFVCQGVGRLPKLEDWRAIDWEVKSSSDEKVDSLSALERIDQDSWGSDSSV